MMVPGVPDLALDFSSLAAWIAAAAGLGTAAYGLVDVFAKPTRYRAIPALIENAEKEVVDLPGFWEIQTLVKQKDIEKRLGEALGDHAIGVLARVFIDDPDGPNLRRILIAVVRNPDADPSTADIDWTELRVDAALATAKAQRIAANRLAATRFAFALGAAGAVASLLILGCNNKNWGQAFQSAALWLFMGVIGVPIAPIAKDISTFLARLAARRTLE